MLSEHELRRLNEIERELRAADPGLAASLSTMSHKRRWALPLALLGWAVFAVAAAAGWWLPALLMLAPLMPITFTAVADRLGNSFGGKDLHGGGGAHERPLDPLG